MNYGGGKPIVANERRYIPAGGGTLDFERITATNKEEHYGLSILSNANEHYNKSIVI